MSNYIYEALYLAFTTGIVAYHAWRFNHGKTVDHALYALLCAGLGMLFVYLQGFNWYLAGALFNFRIWFYNPMLNYFRHKPFFYTHASGPNSSWVDSKIGDWYPVFFGVSLAIFIYLQFKI